MANHALPQASSTYLNFITEVDARIDDLLLGMDPASTTATNMPTGSLRWNSANNYWEKYNGTVWSAMATAYSININGTIGATTPNTGAFTTLSTTGVASLAANSTVGGVAIVTLSGTQTLTSKTLTTPVLSATASGTTAGRLGYSSGVLSFGDGTVQRSVATLDGTETFTNKTLTAPKIADLGFIADPSGNEYLIFDQVASAVNEITIANAATTGNPTITATGGDTNISLNLVAKGTGKVLVGGLEVVTISGSQTLTNKTLTNPTMTTPSLGVATGTSFNSITGLASAAPLVAGTAAVGTSTLTAREDHVHPAQTTITGNAATATALATPRAINGVNFDGTANIRISNLYDSNGLLVFNGIGVASAVNYLSSTSAITGQPVLVAPAGTDTNIGLTINSKGTGTIIIGGTSNAPIELKPGTGTLRLYDDNSSHYYSFATPDITANYTITLPAGNVTLQTGTAAVTSGTLAQFGATTSAQLLGVISDETGTGSLVFATSPTLVTPNIGAATGTSLTLSGTSTAGALVLTTAGNASIEIGRVDGTASTPFIDFHAGATATDYDARIIATVGTGTLGAGTLEYVASIHDFSGTVRAPTINAETTLQIGGVAITSTAAELNILDGVTSTAAELNLLDTAVAGTIVNSKAVIYGAAGQVNATTLQIAGTSITSTAAELNLLDTSVAGSVVNSKALIYGAAGQVNGTTANFGAQSSAVAAANGPILTYTLTSGGTGYTDGSYTGQILSAGTGSGNYATFDFTVAGGIVTVATLTGEGTNFSVGATITIPVLGGTGSGGLITVNTVRSVDLQVYGLAASAPGRIRLVRQSTSVAAGEELGGLYFGSRDASAIGAGDVARILAVAAGTSGGSELEIWTAANGAASTISAKFTSTGNFRLYNSAGTFYNEFDSTPTANRTLTVPDAAGTLMLLHATANTAGYFYTGTTTPTGTTRINYSGYLYPTYINLAGSPDTTTAASHYMVETASDGFVRPKTLANVKAEILDSTGAIFSTTTTATSKTLAVGEYCTVTASGQTITLPATPAAGDTVKIGVLAFSDTIIGRNAQNIMSLAENMTIDAQNTTVTLTFVDATRGWRLA